jgi:hypothetical protein
MQAESLMCQVVCQVFLAVITTNETAGNSYLGGYAAGLHLSGGDPYEGKSARALVRVS